MTNPVKGNGNTISIHRGVLAVGNDEIDTVPFAHTGRLDTIGPMDIYLQIYTLKVSY